jgi:hypothetical protein
MRVLWARKLERYHDLMSFRRRRFIFFLCLFLAAPIFVFVFSAGAEDERRRYAWANL